MKIEQNCLKAGLWMAVLTLLPLAHQAIAKDQAPFIGVEVGTYSAGPFNFPFVTILNDGEGVATHLGRYTVTGSIMINVLAPETVTGNFTITAANGDKLFLIGTGDAPPPSLHPETVLNVTVAGGTGRFEGATGSWVQDSHFAFPFGDVSPNPYVAKMDGTFSIHHEDCCNGDQEGDYEDQGHSEQGER